MKIKDRAKPKAPPVEPGVYMAVCVGVVDLGEQYSEKFKNYSNKLKFVWAIPSETIEADGKQEERQLSREFTFSTSKKGSLRGFLESWNCRKYTDDEFGEINPMDQLGKACQLQVALNDTGEYSNVTNLMPLPKGMPVPQTTTEFFAWDMDQWDDGALSRLPEWAQDQIKKSTQYKTEHAPTQDVAVQPNQTAGQSFVQAMAGTSSQPAPGKGALPF